MTQLFRNEVVRANEHAWLGSIRIVSPRSQAILAYSAVIVFVALIAILLLGHYQRHDTLRGLLVYSYPPIEIIAPAAGQLSDITASVGFSVKAGQSIGYLLLDKTALDGQAKVAIVVPEDGEIITDEVLSGDHINRGQRLFSMRTTSSRLIARIPVDGRDVSYLRPGDQIRLTYPAFPYQRFGAAIGTIRRLEAHPEDPGGHPYEVVVSLSRSDIAANGQKIPLTPGLLVQANIPLERHTLLSWLLGIGNGGD